MDEDYKNLAQLFAIIETKSIKKKSVLEQFLQRHQRILNHQIPDNNYFRLKKPYLIGYTPLHYLIKNHGDYKTFKMFLDYDADFTIKNANGETVFYELTKEYLKDSDICKWKETLQLYFVDTLLSAIISSNNLANPINAYGISHFHIACMLNNVKIVELYLNSGVSVNQAVNLDSPDLPGYTPLHFSARYFCLDVMKILLKNGANVFLKDAKGMSVLHILVNYNMKLVNCLNDNSTGYVTFRDFDDSDSKEYKPYEEFKELNITVFENVDIIKKKYELNEKMIMLLIKWEPTITSNLVDDIGFSYFHVACCLQNFSMLKQMFEKVTDLNHCINKDSLIWPGYTALHFAAHFEFETFKFLLEKGANILTKDANGITPFDLCLKIYDLYKTISVIEKQEDWKNIYFSDGKTKLLDFLVSMQEISTYDSFLKNIDVNIFIAHGSTLWPGYTLLHLAIALYDCNSHYSSENIFKCEHREYIIRKIVQLGADVTVQNAHGLTPIHLAFYERKLFIVDLLLEVHNENVNPTDENGLSHLHIACVRKKNVKKFLNSLNVNCSLKNSFFIPKLKSYNSKEYSRVLHFSADSTPLHLVVGSNNFDNYNIFDLIDELKKYGANIYLQDVDGFTPIHNAFIRHDGRTVHNNTWKEKFMKNDLKNSVANCGLSHLHIACCMDDVSIVEKILDLGVDVNEKITHTLPKNIDDAMCELLLQEWEETKFFFERNILGNVISFIKRYTGYTPLQFAIENRQYNVISVLLQRGADIFIKKSDGSILLSKLLTDRGFKKIFFEVYKKDEKMQELIEKETGLTILHIACAVFDMNTIVKVLDKIDVNTCARSDSPIWPGCTPLHVLAIEEKQENVCEIINLLIDRGASILIQNKEYKTPLHELVDQFNLFPTNSVPPKLDLAIFMLKGQLNYNLNPVDSRGISHFHIACMCNDISCVTKFLEHGVDVNQKTDYFVKSCNGYTPLHIAALRKSRETIIMLLQHNADVHAKNSMGESPIQKIAFRKGFTSKDLDLLIKSGADINGKDIFGDTPIESLMRGYANKEVIFIDDKEIINIAINYKCRLNVFYPGENIGFVGRNLKPKKSSIFNREEATDKEKTISPVIQAVINAPDMNYVDSRGRSVIHNIVAVSSSYGTSLIQNEYIEAIEKLTKVGFDVDHQDDKGFTPLHLAVYLNNLNGIVGLLKNGADWNISDKKGRPAFAYVRRLTGYLDDDDIGLDIVIELYRHFKKLQRRNLHISHANKYIVSQQTKFLENQADDKYARYNLEVFLNADNLKIEPYSLTLYDFSSETGAVSSYIFMDPLKRQTIDKFFQSNYASLNKKFPELVGILYLQYRKAVARKNLIKPALSSLNVLLGFELPYICSRTILKLLSNDELKVLIASIEENE